jgi:MOSC domain
MMTDVTHLTMAELEAGLDHIRQSPKDEGALQLIVRRPKVGEREVLEEGALDVDEGLVGDTWRARAISRSADGMADPQTQLNIMNARTIALVAGPKERWPLAGDQLFIDIDLSEDNVPAGTRLAIGSAVIEVSEEPHTGCKKFVARFGVDAVKFVNSAVGRQLHLRGVNARVVQPGVIRVGDAARKIPASTE